MKDYDCSINYYPGKVNVVAYTLSKKSFGGLAHMTTTQDCILEDLRKMEVEVVAHGKINVLY